MTIWNENDLNPEQKAAIQEEGSVFLVACPGSGKTRTLTYKIAYELSRLQSDKKFISGITYTHRAADEIHERIEDLGIDTSQLWIGTIHSFCLEWILKPYGIYHHALSRGFRVIDPHEREEILEELCKPYSKQKITHWDCDFYCTEEGYKLSCLQTSKHDSLHIILKAYFKILNNNRQIDFELILYYAYQLIKSHPSISEILSKLFPYILIDEYQDTKHIQYLIIASILKAGLGDTRTFIVGDPNQAIFHSFGGYPITADEFEVMSSIKLKQLRLSKNYRSSERIVEYFDNYKVHDTAIEAASNERGFPSFISFNDTVTKSELETELERLIRYNIETIGVVPHEICVLAPWWVHLASMTRRLVTNMPEYQFNGPGMVPFATNIDNFWYKLSRIVLTEASPGMYVRRLRWAGEILKDMELAGINVSQLTRKLLLRECNSVVIKETDGLLYLKTFFETLFKRINIDFLLFAMLKEHHHTFFESSQARITKLKKEGAEFISDVSTFKKVFQNKTGITISTIHSIKGAEYDVVIAYALLEGMVPHFNDDQDSAMCLLYVIGSRARKNLHLISERERYKGANSSEYQTTLKLAGCNFKYDVIP